MKRTLLVLASLSVLVACAEGPAPISPRDAVLDAMSAVYEAGTYHQELEMSLSAEGQSFSITGVADVDNERQKIDMTMDLGLLGGEMQVVMDGGIVYMRSPAFADAPTPWVSMDPEKMDPARAAQFGGFGAGTTDPSAYAGLFAGVFDVKDSGQVEIRGVSTTHYVGTIDLEKVMASFSDMMGEDVDPATKEPAVKNIFAAGGRLSVAESQKRGVVFLMCNTALRLRSRALATERGETYEAVYEDLKASRLPGMVLVPALVVALNRAQEAGFSYLRV